MIQTIKYSFLDAWQDISATLRNRHQTFTLGWQDVMTRYRRSRVGAFWLTINVAVMLAALGTVFGTIFGQPMSQFLPYLTIALVVWEFLSVSIKEGCTAFVEAEGIILQVRMPLFTHITRIIWRNLIIFGHNLLILPIVYLIFMKPVTLVAFLALPGFLVLMCNVAWIMLVLAVLCARYRDVTQVALNVLQVMFYLTPIFWSAENLPDRAGTALLDYNPFYHLISLVRVPLLGGYPTLLNWAFSLLLLIVGWTVAFLFYGHYRKRVSYWL